MEGEAYGKGDNWVRLDGFVSADDLFGALGGL